VNLQGGEIFLQSDNNFSEVRIKYDDRNAVELLSKSISSAFKKDTLIICIGTDKCIGDCLGPLVGTMLIKNSFPLPVIGTLENPAHAINLGNIINEVNIKYPDHHIIAVDACLGYRDYIGEIQIKNGPVRPGKGVGKSLPKVGDISIIGITDSLDDPTILTLRNIRLNFIINMAETITKSILYALDLSFRKDNLWL
jgi:putative sporulation protein YyaC